METIWRRWHGSGGDVDVKDDDYMMTWSLSFFHLFPFLHIIPILIPSFSGWRMKTTLYPLLLSFLSPLFPFHQSGTCINWGERQSCYNKMYEDGTRIMLFMLPFPSHLFAFFSWLKCVYRDKKRNIGWELGAGGKWNIGCFQERIGLSIERWREARTEHVDHDHHVMSYFHMSLLLLTSSRCLASLNFASHLHQLIIIVISSSCRPVGRSSHISFHLNLSLSVHWE